MSETSAPSSHIKICVYSAAQELGQYHAAEVRIPAFDGQMGILADHADIGGAMTVGIVEFAAAGYQHQFQQDQTQAFFVTGGFFEMKNNLLTLLVSVWEEASAVDIIRAQAAKSRAISRLSGDSGAHADGTDGKVSSTNVSRALHALRRAEMRLATSELREQA